MVGHVGADGDGLILIAVCVFVVAFVAVMVTRR
jgi:hypothetical protein